MQCVHTLLKLAQLRLTDHVTRMPDECLPKKILYGELQAGKRSHVGQKKRYNDTLRASLKHFNIQQSRENRLHRIQQSGEASFEGVLVNTRQRESAKPRRKCVAESENYGITNRAFFLRPLLFYLQQAV